MRNELIDLFELDRENKELMKEALDNPIEYGLTYDSYVIMKFDVDDYQIHKPHL